MTKHTLYICYFGLRQPLVQTQVIPYLREIAAGGIRVSLLTFEPEMSASWTAGQIQAERESLGRDGIEWDMLAYHKHPSAIATAYDILAGIWFVRRRLRTTDIDVLHGRVHVATLMGALARKYSRRRPELIFDIRGFFPEEYTDAGVWAENGWLYRIAKYAERWLMREANAFVVLTEKAKNILFPEVEQGDDSQNRAPIVEVIPCCVDFDNRFVAECGDRDSVRQRLGIEGRFVIAHVGALGGLYLTRELVDFLDEARKMDQSTYALFLTQTDAGELRSLLRERGFLERDMLVDRVDPSDVPAYLAAADVGLSFVKATYATQSRSPTKIPEYLAAGLPIIANSGVGDVDELIRTEGVGVLIERFEPASYRDAIDRLNSLGNISQKCRETAIRRFDLRTVGGPRYRRLYERIFCNDTN